MTATISRESLYEAVWNEPVYKVAHRLGVTGTALAKTCKKNDIPVPDRGYWAKLYSGQIVSPQPLQPSGHASTIRIGQRKAESRPWQANGNGCIRRKCKLEDTSSLPPQNNSATPSSFFAISLDRRLTGERLSQKVVLNVEERTQFRISIGVRSINRVVMLIDELCHLAELAGYEVRPTDNGLGLRVGNEVINVAISERLRQRSDGPMYPGGRLELTIDGGRSGDGIRRRFIDSDNQRLESLLPHIVGSVAACAASASKLRGCNTLVPAKTVNNELELERRSLLRMLVRVQQEIDGVELLLRTYEQMHRNESMLEETAQFLEWSHDYATRLRRSIQPSAVRQRIVDRDSLKDLKPRRRGPDQNQGDRRWNSSDR